MGSWRARLVQSCAYNIVAMCVILKMFCLILAAQSSGKAVPGRDVVVFVSHSGNTSECVAAAAQLIKRGVATLALTGRPGISSF